MAEENLASFQIIRAAYPELSQDEIRKLALDGRKIEYAKKITQKNVKTHWLIQGYSRTIPFGDFIEKCPDDLTDLFNPCYKAKPSPDKPVAESLFDVLCQINGYKHVTQQLSKFFEEDIRPWRLETVISPSLVAPSIRQDLFMTLKERMIPYKYNYLKPDQGPILKEINETKQNIDRFFGKIAEKFPGSLAPFIKEVFSTPETGPIDFNKEYAFQKGKPLDTVFSFLLKNKMCQTANALINEVLRQNNRCEDVIDLISGQETYQLFHETSLFSPPEKLTKQQEAVLQVKRHLEKKIPTDMFISHVEHKNPPQSWRHDFDRGM